MTNILFPNLSIVEVTDGTNITQCLVTAVSGTSVTVATSNQRILWTNAAATATRIHGYGALHWGTNSNDAAYVNVSSDASTNCPVFVYVVDSGSMFVSNAYGQSGSHSPNNSIVIGNQPGQVGQQVDAQMCFTNCTEWIVANPEHPYVTVNNIRPNFGRGVTQDGNRAKQGPLDYGMALMHRVWTFNPKDTSNASNNSHRWPIVRLSGEANTLQKEWAWYVDGFGGNTALNMWDETLPTISTSYVRIRIRARSVGTGYSQAVTAVGNGGTNIANMALTPTMQIFEYVIATPATWIGVKNVGGTGFQLVWANPNSFYVAGASVEELSANEVGFVNGTLQVIGTITPTGGLVAPVSILSNSASTQAPITLGRTAAEATIVIPWTAGQYSTSAAAGDLVIRNEAVGRSIWLQTGGAGAAIQILGTATSILGGAIITGVLQTNSGIVGLAPGGGGYQAPFSSSAFEAEIGSSSLITIGDQSAGGGNPAITFYRTAAGGRNGSAYRLLGATSGPVFKIQRGTTNANYGAETYTDVATFDAAGLVTLASGLTVSASGVTVTGNSTITGTLGGLTGLTFTSGNLTVADAGNVVVGSTTGTQIGTAITQKLGFYGATAIAQRAGAAQTAVAATASTSTAPFGYTTAAQADAIVTLVNELRAWAVAQGFIKGSA
jgi:hypothetical protein